MDIKIIEEYLNDAYQLGDGPIVDISTNRQIMYTEIESSINTIFDFGREIGGVIVFNWLLDKGIQLIKKNWNTTYATRNKLSNEKYISTVKEGADFNYKSFITNE